jgi:predicted nucleic acid-binding protein
MRFVDTNVLLYAVSTASSEATKAVLARQVLEADDLALSVQVLQEFYVQATRAGRKERLSHEQAALLVEAWLRFPVQETTVPLVRAALETKRRHRVSYWDAAIIEAARFLECDELLSEDLAHGRDYDGVRVSNPFRRSRKVFRA